MIRLITGDFGSGKTTALAELIAADVAAGKHGFLLVPEQQTVTAERDMADMLPPSAPLCFEVSNFTRLANTVFREVGGVAARYASAGTRTLLMWRAMSAMAPHLHGGGKGGVPDIGRVRKMAAAVRELSMLAITPKQLENAAQMLEEGSRLREKLTDLSLIATAYSTLLNERYADTADDLARLAELLAEQNPLAGAHIYIDGFISYTEQQYRILRALCRDCDLTVTLTLPAGREEELAFAETAETARRIGEIARRSGVELVRRDLGANRRARAPLLQKILPHIFEKQSETDPVCRENTRADGFSVVAAQDAFAACEYIAADIARRVLEEGARYRDFAVVVRRTESYVGILDVAFQQADIPCFLSKRTDIDTYPAVKLIYSAYAVCTGGWRQSDLITYLKCGLSGISADDIDIFELYTARWRLSGRRITADTPWTMNPDGYTDRINARTADILSRVACVRERVLDQLLPLAEGCGVRPLREHCRTLYEFLVALGVEEQLASRAEAARVSRKRAEAEELSRLFGVITDALDGLVDALPDIEVNAEGFLDLLKLMLHEVNMAQIPTSVDEVTVGSADLLRTGNVKHVYLLGVNEGEFPAACAPDAGVFSEGDRRVLASLGLSVSPDLLLRSARELFCFARAFSSAEESVTLLYAENSLGGLALTPASQIADLCLLAHSEIIRAKALTPAERFYRSGAALDYLGLLAATPAGHALARFFAEKTEYALTLSRTRAPLVEPNCRLSSATARDLYGRGIGLTQARIDKYVRCPFAFFCEYVLQLDPGKTIEFDYADTGNLLHEVLERFFGQLAKEDRAVRDIATDELYARVDTIIEDYLNKICPAEAQRTPRLLHLISRLRRSARAVVEELAEELVQSEFTPALFELSLAGEGEEDPGGLPFTLPDGTRVSLYGRIDRVDTWRDGDRTYLRVVDYKSGKKVFSLEDISRGLNLQLLVYLFSLWKSKNPKFVEKLAGKDGELLPAAMLYVGASVKRKTYDTVLPEGEIMSSARRTVFRSGLFLEDERVLRAQDRELAGRFIPIKATKDGYHKYSLPSLTTLEKLGALVGDINTTVCRIAGGMRAGDAAVRPLLHKKTYACKYCDMQSVCRSSREQ